MPLQLAAEPMLILDRKQSLAIPLRIDAVDRGTSLVLVVEGELDLISSPALDAALRWAEGTDTPRIVIDLHGVSFIDSTGLHVLINHACAQEHAGRIRLTNASARAQRLFELSGAVDHLPFLAD